MKLFKDWRNSVARVRVVPHSLSPLCVMRKKTAWKKWPCGYFFLIVFFRVTHNGLRASSCGLAQFPRSRLTTLSFVTMAISLYGEPDWPGYQDLVVCDGNLSYRKDNFPVQVCMGDRDETFWTK